MIPALAEAERSIRSAAVNNGNRRVFGVSRVPVIFAKNTCHIMDFMLLSIQSMCS